MTRCPHCQHELPPTEELVVVCPQCGANWSAAATFDPAANDTTIDLGRQAITDLTPPQSNDQTIDLTPPQTNDQTIDLSPQPTIAVPPPQPTIMLPNHATIEPSVGEHAAESDVDRIQRTWNSIETSHLPNMTIKAPVASNSSSQLSLIVRDREVRSTETDQLASADYDLISQLGEGGMGVVYTARQASIDRTVAVKMLKPQTAQDEGQRQKFLSEAVVTGELDHPNIVPIYELGRNTDGSLFYSMKKVQGIPWMNVLPQKSLAENIEILMKAADAVAFAHSRGIVHRDLKPENIMLGEFGEVLVLDWGLALPTVNCRKSMHLVGPMGMGGTPSYMAPEMVLGPVENIGIHSDVYLLGAILYECVNGYPPHTGKNAMQCLFAAGKNEIRPASQEGELLNIALRAMATDPQERFPSVQEFQHAIRTYQSHSESIALTARAAEELAQAQNEDDYQQFARALYVFEEAFALWPENDRAKDGVAQAKLAYAESAYRRGDYELGLSVIDTKSTKHAELATRLRRAQVDRDARQQRLRNAKRAIGLLAALVFIAVTAGMILFLAQKNEADRQRAIAVVNEQEARQQRTVANQQRDEADRQRANALRNESEARRQEQIAIGQRERAETSEEDAINKRKLAEYEAYIAWIGLADSKIKENALGQAREVLEQCSPDLHDWEWYRLMHQCRQGLSRIVVGERLDCVAVNGDGTSVAAGARDGTVRVWSLPEGTLRGELKLEHSFASRLAFSPTDPQQLAIASGDPDGLLRLWDLGSDSQMSLPVGHTDRLTSVEFSPDGQLLLTASFDNTARLYSLAEQRTTHVLRGHSWWVWSACFSNQGQRIVTASQDGTVRIWEAGTGLQITNESNEPMPFRGHTGPVYTACFSPDDEQVASGGFDGRIILWRPDQLQAFDYQGLVQNESPTSTWQQWDSHAAAISRIVFSHDGRLVLSAGHDNLVKSWWAKDDTLDGAIVKQGSLYKSLRGHDSLVRDIATLPTNPDLVISASYDGQIRLWSIADYEESRVIPGRILQGHSDAILQATFSPTSDRIVTASRDRSARIWSSADGHAELVLREGHGYLTSSAVFFPLERTWLLTAAVDGTARIWDTETGTQRSVLNDIGPSAAVAVSPDGRWIATSSVRDETNTAVKLWDAHSGQVVRTLADHQVSVTAATFSNDSRILFTGDANGRGNVWEVETGRLLATARRHTARISAARFMMSDQSLLTASEDNTVFRWRVPEQIWAAADSPIRLSADESTILRHPQAVTSMALDNDRILTGCRDGIVRLWNSLDGSIVWQWRTATNGNINAVDVAPQASLALAVDSFHHRVCLLDLATGAEIQIPSENGTLDHFLDLRERGAIAWSAAFSTDGQAVVTVGGDEARLWDLQGREHLSLGPHRTISSADFSPDGQQIATASWDNSAKLWDANQGRPILKLDDHVSDKPNGHSARVNSVAYAPIGQRLVTASDDGTLKIWDAASGTVLKTLIGHDGPVLHAMYSNDGQRIVSASRDATAIVWDATSGEQLLQLKGHQLPVLHAAYSADSRQIATCSEDFRAIIWDAHSGKRLVTLPEQTDRVTSVAFSPSGTRLLTGCADRSVKLWDTNTGREILTLKGHLREVTSVSFSRQGEMVLSSSRDGTAIVWPSIAHRKDGEYSYDVDPLADVGHSATPTDEAQPSKSRLQSLPSGT